MFVVVCASMFSEPNCFSADTATQHSSGNQNANVNVGPGGTANFNYGAPDKIKNVAPTVKCKMVFPWRIEKGTAEKQTVPDVSFTNTGPIKAIAFSVDYEKYLFDKSQSAIVYNLSTGDLTNGHFVSVKELQPTESIKRRLDGFDVDYPSGIGIYVFIISYYREYDMKAFKQKEVFFRTYDVIFSEKNYVKKPYYKEMIEAMKSHKPKGPTIYGEIISESDGGTSFVLTTPKTGISILNDNQSLTYTGVIPEDPRAFLKECYAKVKRPLLFATPVKSQTGAYVNNLQIADVDTLKGTIRYEVENIGYTDPSLTETLPPWNNPDILKGGEGCRTRRGSCGPPRESRRSS